MGFAFVEAYLLAVCLLGGGRGAELATPKAPAGIYAALPDGAPAARSTNNCCVRWA